MHLGVPASPECEKTVMALTLDKTLSRYSFECAIPEIEQAQRDGDVYIFLVLVDKKTWAVLPDYLKAAMLVKASVTEDRNRSYFDFDNVTEDPVLDNDFMHELCTRDLQWLYTECDRRARQSLKQGETTLHDIIQSYLAPAVHAWTEKSNKELANMQKQYAKELEIFEGQVRADKTNPMLRRPAPPHH